MKSGRSIQDVSREILRQQEAKADYFLMFPASCAASFYCAYCYENTLVWSWYAVYGTCSDVL